MKGLVVSAIAAVALLSAATGIMRSHPLSNHGFTATAGMSTLQDMQSGRADKLPVETFEDRSLVYPREATR